MNLSMFSLIAGNIEGIPLSYAPRMDDGLALVLLGCFFLSGYVLSRCRKLLVLLGRNYLLNRERTSIFATSTTADMHTLLLLILQTRLLLGIYLFLYFIEVQPLLLTRISPFPLWVIYVGFSLLYFLAKWFLYSFIGWIFFDKVRRQIWFESYSTLLYFIGFILFPFVLLLVYFKLHVAMYLIIGLILFVFVKILVLFKWIKLFCSNLYGCFLLILYFCALEIAPCFIFFKGMAELNEYLIIKI